MEEKNAKIFVSSVKNITDKLEVYGNVDLSKIFLLKLIYKYSCYATTYATLQRLDKMVAYLQRTSKDICSEYTASQRMVSESIIGVVDIVTGVVNNAPTISPNSATLDSITTVFTFVSNQIYSSFSDPDGNSPGNFVIKVLPTTGTLQYNGVNVSIDTLYSDPTKLTYTRAGTSGYSDTFSWAVFDNDTQLPLESNTVVMSITVTAFANSNEPATVGDRVQYAGNRVTTVFTVADFTTQTIAPYFDPEANDLDAIRIDEVSTANSGVYYYYDAPVVEGQIITAAELAAGAFYHIGADANGIVTDSFNASVRDTGSMIWVS